MDCGFTFSAVGPRNLTSFPWGQYSIGLENARTVIKEGFSPPSEVLCSTLFHPGMSEIFYDSLWPGRLAIQQENTSHGKMKVDFKMLAFWLSPM